MAKKLQDYFVVVQPRFLNLATNLAAARSLSLSFLACLVSGLYLSISLNSWVAANNVGKMIIPRIVLSKT